MPVRILSVSTVQKRLREAASAADGEQLVGIEPIKASYETQLSELKSKLSSDAFERAQLRSAEDFANAIDNSLTQGNEEERQCAAADLVKAYGRLFEVGEEALTSPRRVVHGGRSGTVVFSTSARIEHNNRWMAFLNSDRIKDIGVVGAKVPIASEARGQATPNIGPPVAPCRPARYRVSITKPDPEQSAGSDGGTLSPGFLAYLRATGQLALRNFEEWCQATGNDDSQANYQEYQTALAAAERAYETQSWNRRYCETSDIPMPGIHRGHRLLKLSIPIEPGDFRFNYCDDPSDPIYQGPAGRLAPPDVEYDTLVRRYVQDLKNTIRYAYDLEKLDEHAVREFAEGKTGVYGQRTLERFVVASTIALQHADFVERLSTHAEAGAPGFGPPPESVGEWLRSDEAEGLRSDILSAWGTPDAEAPGPSPGQGMISLVDFVREASRLCISTRFPDILVTDLTRDLIPVANIALSPGEFYSQMGIPYYDPNKPEEEQVQELYQKVKSAVDYLAGAYNRIWQRARQNLGSAGLWAQKDICLSGYEMRAYIYVLTVHTVLDGSQGTAPNNWINIHSNILDGAIEKFRNDLRDQPINMDIVPAVSWTDEGTKYTIADKHAWDAVVTSYKSALDAVLSFLSAGATLQLPSEPPAGGGAEQPYDTWTDLFVRFIEAHVHGQPTIPDNFLVLRLAPRTGRYGEVPQRAPADRFSPPTERSLSPRHPTRLTESYELEPLPDKYFWFDTPTVYLREDYSFSVQHRGFGIGANLYSLSLLPEEERTIVMKSVKDTKSMVSESTAENILEEAGSETESDFAQEVSRESERETSNQESGEVTARASASWGFGSAEVSGSYSAQSSSRNMAKNVSNVSDRLSNKLSAKRKVAIDTERSEDTSIEMHEEVSTKRKIRNPNKGHTITFNWYQMTRMLGTELHLDDMNLVYTSGKHNTVRAFVKGEVPQIDDPDKAAALHAVAMEMPADVARLMPPESVIVVVTDPYTEVVPLAAANAFLARIFTESRAVDINSTIWQTIGLGPVAPEGLNVAAFSGMRRSEDWDFFTPLFSDDPTQYTDGSNPKHVIADRVTVEAVSVDAPAAEFYLPNIDLRYLRSESLPPTRYQGTPQDADVVPRLLMSKEQVINTNGVYCDAMVGQCSVLEDYLQRHRSLDLIEKKIEVGKKELEFKWLLTKDGMVEVKMDADGAILGIVKEEEENKGFEERLAVESAKREEEIERRQHELALLEQRVEELKARIAKIGEPRAYSINVPKQSQVTVNANLGSKEDPASDSADVNVEEGNE